MFFCEALLLLSWLFVTCSVQGGVTFKVQLCWHCWHCAATGEVTQARRRRSHESEKSLWLYVLFIIWRSKILLSAPLVLLLNVHFFVAVLYDRINTCSIIAVFFNLLLGGPAPIRMISNDRIMVSLWCWLLSATVDQLNSWSRLVGKLLKHAVKGTPKNWTEKSI